MRTARPATIRNKPIVVKSILILPPVRGMF